MPTPIAHSMIGLTICASVIVPAGSRIREGLRSLLQRPAWLLLMIFAANMPDLDYLPGLLEGEFNKYHHLYTHTLGWIILAGGGMILVKLAISNCGWKPFATVIMACLVTHLVADTMTDDTRPPIGIMLLWPFTDAHFHTPFWLFPRVNKLNLSDALTIRNIYVGIYELAVTMPLFFGVLYCKSRGRKDLG